MMTLNKAHNNHNYGSSGTACFAGVSACIRRIGTYVCTIYAYVYLYIYVYTGICVLYKSREVLATTTKHKQAITIVVLNQCLIHLKLTRNSIVHVHVHTYLRMTQSPFCSVRVTKISISSISQLNRRKKHRDIF